MLPLFISIITNNGDYLDSRLSKDLAATLNQIEHWHRMYQEEKKCKKQAVWLEDTGVT